MYKKYGKRALDILFALLALVILSPLLLVVALLVKLKLGSPIIFSQERPGKDNKIFKIYKFRTMTNQTDAQGNLLPDEQRLTRFGAFLRKTSLDELPELVNILKGDMSLVGPRPQLIKDMAFFNAKIAKRQTVLPGLTGLAQIKGRNNISWEQKFVLDLEYCERITFRQDISIIFSTIGAVLSSRDVNTEGRATAEDYGDYLLRTGQISPLEYKEKLQSIDEKV